MSILAEFTIPAEAFALEHTFHTIPDSTIEVERLATHSREWVMPLLWATNGDLAEVESALRDDPTVDEVKPIDVDGEIGYFNVTWEQDVQELIDQIVDQHGIMQEAEATDGCWYLKLQFIDQEALKEFQAYFRGRSIVRVKATPRRNGPERTRVRPDVRAARSTGDSAGNGVLYHPPRRTDRGRSRGTRHFDQCGVAAITPRNR